MGDKIRFGIIGGGMAGPLNAGALRDIPEAEVVAFGVCGSWISWKRTARA